jgi:RNA-binding protein
MQKLKATIWIGKRGVTEGTIEEIRHQLKTRHVVKIRWLRSIEIDVDEICARCGAELLHVRGRTVVLAGRHMKSP